MFEGLVRQLILGYLGQYIKDIQQEQLKITLWNEEVLLENVELILEAFDYLQLPFALKTGLVGKLSIKIPWKKLGWDPIIIILEDVVICACQREDKEWSADAIERREFAGKKAKLAAAELAKLSRRVCDNQTGKSFISYITAKILDGIQVSVRNVHVQYRDMLTASVGFLFGLNFSSLTIMRQNLTGVSGGKVRGAQVNKVIKVQGLGFYCSTFEGSSELVNADDALLANHQGIAGSEDNKHAYMLAPLDVSVFLSVNRLGKLENDAPQYSMNVELSRLVISVNEMQLKQMMTIYDYLSTCQLREKYGRYRPWWSPLEKKGEGWKTSWWHYAQESVLSDVKKRLRKKSWIYLGVRLKCRRNYVNLYKTKLKCLQQDQVIDEDVLRELEEMEKEYDIDDILSYRSAAEHELEDFLVNSFSNSGSNSSNPDDSLEDEQASGKGRGWLNWLSRGMLGAGGTDDSCQFSGVISDDVIQDIYEATKFRPVTSLNGDAATTNKIYLSSVKLNTSEIYVTLRSLKLGCAIACLVLDDISTECKIWEESVTLVASAGSAKILNARDMQAILFTRKVDLEKNVAGSQQPALDIHVDALPPNAEASLSVKVVIQPMEILCDFLFISSIMEFYYILEHVSFQYERILSSLNGIENIKARVLSKTEFILSNRKRMTWDINFVNIVIVVPWGSTNSKPHQLVFEAGEFSLLSKGRVSSLLPNLQSQSYLKSKYVNCGTSSDDFLDFQLQDLYDNFEINIGYFEVNILMPYSVGTVPLLERSSASVTLATCIIPDEPIMKRMDVNTRVSSLLAHFSPSVYKAIIGLVTHFNMIHQFPESTALKTVETHFSKPNGQMTSHAIWFSITSSLELVSVQVDLENDERNTNTMMIYLKMVDIWFDKKEFAKCCTCTKALRVNLHQGQAECETLVLSSSENLFRSESTEHVKFIFRHGNEGCDFADITSFTDGCFLFQYHACRKLGCVSHKHKILINNIDIHCYPFLVGLLASFFDKIFGYDKPIIGDETPMDDEKSLSLVPVPELRKFGFSNFSGTGPMECASIPLDTFPFVTIHNHGSLANLETSLIYAMSEWREKVTLQDEKSRSPSFNAEAKVECFDATSKATYGAELLPQSWNENQMIKVDLIMGSIKVDFHDSSCIVGTLSLPVARSFFSICNDHFDILCSIDGLTLSCSWWSQMIHDFLWGPLVPHLSPILNIRVKKEYGGFKKSFLRVSFGIQHVSCILPPDVLAVLIAYFSLPEWNSGAMEQPVSGNSEYACSEDETAVEYKFEILDSNLLVPAYLDGFQFLKLDVQQLYCSFIGSRDKDAAMKGIPTECSVMTDKVADRNNCLNLFGCDLSLSLLLPKDDIIQPSSLHQVSGWKNFTLIAPFSADVWVTIPFQCETSGVTSTYPICIMGRVTNCQLNIEGACIIVGFEALENVINEFSLTGERSTVYTGDVAQFLQIIRGLVENAACLPQVSSISSIWIAFSVSSMRIRLHQLVEDSITSEVIADAEMGFACSVSLVNDIPVFLDISFSSLTLFSLLNSVMLVECATTCSSSSLRVIFSVSEAGENKFHLCLPSLAIWLHRYDWSQMNDVLTSYFGGSSNGSTTQQSPNSLTYNHKDPILDVTAAISKDSLQSQDLSSRSAPENLQQDSSFYHLQLEDFGVKVLVPAQVNGNECEILNKNLNDSGISICGNQLGFVTFSVQSKSSELVVDGKIIRMKINLEKAISTMELFHDTNEASWPLFRFSQILLEGEITNYQMAHIHTKCDTLDVWLSSRVLHLRCLMPFKVPESGPSHNSFCNWDLKVQLRKFTLLFIDGKWSPSGSLLEVVMGNIFFLANTMEGEMEGSIEGDLHVNYNNIDKVLWEPFIEPWQLQLTIARKNGNSVLLNSVITTNIHLKSRSQLNLNVNESLIEVISRTIAMIEDAWSVMRSTIPPEVQGFPTYQMTENLNSGRYAPYIVQNLTSLPIVFHVCKGLSSGDLDVDSLSSLESNRLQPDSSVPVYVDETPEEQLVRHRPSQSSERLSDNHVYQASHRYILIKFEGTTMPSGPISMDLVGLRFFEVDFSKSSNKSEVDHAKDGVRSSNKVEGDPSSENSGFGVPVVIDVSVEQYTKLIRLYSTVVLCNSTPVPLEVRFDIPLGVSPKILDPVYPGHEFPLPLHLAEAGFMRCRPLGNSYLWSEAYSISNILSHENKISFLRSIVCYPSLPSSDPFRCCILVKSNCLPSVDKQKKGLSLSKSHYSEYTENSGQSFHDRDTTKQHLIHWVTLSSPLILKNYLPDAVSLILDNGIVIRNALLLEVETSFFHIDSSHDLTITLDIHGFRTSSLKFQRAETFCSMAKFDGTKLSLSETITFYPEFSGGPLCVTIEKIMDAFSGAREICISVPFLLSNCTGFPLVVSNSLDETKGHGITIPSCYDLDADVFVGRKDGLSLLSSNEEPGAAGDTDKLMMASSQGHILAKLNEFKSFNKPLKPFSSSTLLQRNSQNYDPDAHRVPVSTFSSEFTLNNQLNLKSTSFVGRDNKKVGACIYSPETNSSPGELMVRVSRCVSSGITGNIGSCPWSSPFPLVPPTGSISVLVPQQSLNTGHVVSVSAVAAPFSGRTRIITFQPRYVISNACNKALCYKQKGTDFVILLDAGQHSNIQWTDTTRDLLVSVRFDEPGWQWSGCFLPEHLGDTQVKIHNYLSGSVIMMRIEVQSADLTIKDEEVVGSPRGNSGTNIILVSIDDTGFMPYRIDNFSKERLRVYQQRCETFETLVNSYTSCQYAWDEPCYPHRLTVEVPGERVIGSYALDDVKDFSPVHLPSSLEKPGRTLFVSVHSEGSIKVLSIIDSAYHNLSDLKSQCVPQSNYKRNHAQRHEFFDHCTERIAIEIPFIGISLMNSSPEELIFACAKGVAVDIKQSLDQQKFALQISSLQIDNQLHNTPYPVILSFDCDGHPLNQIKMIDDLTKTSSGVGSGNSQEPVFSLAVAKWRTKDIKVVSFEYISLRVADFHLELEQEIVLSLVDFIKAISLRFQSRVLHHMESTLHPLFPDVKVVRNTSAGAVTQGNKFVSLKGKHQFSGEQIINEEQKRDSLLAQVIPIGAPWQKIHLLARQQKKIYIELLDLAPIKLSLSFSSSPWMLRDGVLISGESLIHRGLVTLADIEGAKIHLRQLILSHQLASWESVQEILIRHYTRQFLHEMYKLFGSAGVLGNPIGFARSVGLGIKDFLSAPVQNVFQSPAGLITGMAQGTSSLLSNTVYAISDAATQFSKVAHKGIVTFTFDEQIGAKFEKQQKGTTSRNKGLINGLFEGLTGLLQSPIKGAEKHGLPGVLSGIALGVTGLVARPAASILEVTGKTAQSIRNRSKVHRMGSQPLRVRLPRPLSNDLALKPYSWEEAVGTSVLAEADEGMKLRNEILVLCKRLKQGGKNVIITERLVLVVSCSSLVDLGESSFKGIPAEPEWVIETDVRLDSVIHADNNEEMVHIVGSSSDPLLRQNQNQHKRVAGNKGMLWNNSQTLSPLFHANLEFMCKNDAENFLRVLLSLIEKGKDQGWGRVHLLHQSNLK